jgi:outer membrane lipoprotein SlyB
MKALDTQELEMVSEVGEILQEIPKLQHLTKLQIIMLAGSVLTGFVGGYTHGGWGQAAVGAIGAGLAHTLGLIQRLK